MTAALSTPSHAWASLALATFLAAGCTSAPTERSSPSRSIERALLEREVALYDQHGALLGGRSAPRISIRAGGGILAYLQSRPHASYMFFLNEPRHAAGGPSAPYSRPPMPILEATDIAWVTSGTVTEAWYLYGASGRIVSDNLGGFRSVVFSLPTRTATSACAHADSTLYVLDSVRVGVVAVRAPRGEFKSLALPLEIRAELEKYWSAARLDGSNSGPCVLWSPYSSRIVLLNGSQISQIVPLVEAAPQHNWIVRLWAWIIRRPLSIGTVDVARIPGGTASLYSGETSHAGRLIDFYSDETRYVKSWLLPDKPRGVASSSHRLFAIVQRGDSVLFQSFILPRQFREADAAREPDPFAPKPPKDAATATQNIPENKRR